MDKVPKRILSYFMDNPARFHVLAGQMETMHDDKEWRACVHPAVTKAHTAVSVHLRKLAKVMVANPPHDPTNPT